MSIPSSVKEIYDSSKYTYADDGAEEKQETRTLEYKSTILLLLIRNPRRRRRNKYKYKKDVS
jgi:hypothetical protein